MQPKPPQQLFQINSTITTGKQVINMYQARRVPFCNKENYNEKRASRANEKIKNRRLSRQKNFSSNRDIAVDLVEAVSNEDKVPQKLSRYEQLLQWRQEKELLKKKEQGIKTKKPPFKCGTVHHKQPPILEAGCRRSARIKNPVNEIKIPITKSLNVTGRARNNQPSSSKKFHSFAPASHQFKAPSNLPKIEEISIPQPVDVTEQESTLSMSFPAQLSPWISKSRGSDGKKGSPTYKGKNESPIDRKKSRTPIKIAELIKGTPDDLRRIVGKRLVQQSLKTPEELGREEIKCLSSTTTPVLSNEDADVLHNFQSLYEGEMNRLDNLSSQWDCLLASETSQEIPVEIQNSIFATVGQTRLLMREKLKQFNDLLHKFKLKSSKSKPVITCSDLQGFWDLVSIQVNDVDAKFSSLDALKWNNWVGADEPKAKPEKAIVRRRGINKKISKTKNPPAAKSAFKTFIADQIKKNEAKHYFEAVNKDAVEEKTFTSTMAIAQRTPTTILKRRSSRKLSFRNEIDQQGGSITPRRSSRRVTFADESPGDFIIKPKVRSTPHVRVSKGSNTFGGEQSLLSVKSPNFDADLISWESPTKDYLSVSRRKSPRFSTETHNSYL